MPCGGVSGVTGPLTWQGNTLLPCSGEVAAGRRGPYATQAGIHPIFGMAPGFPASRDPSPLRGAPLDRGAVADKYSYPVSSWACPVILGLPCHPELAEGSPASPCVILSLPKDPQPRQVLTSEGYREHFQPFRQEPLLRGRQQTNRCDALLVVHAEQRNPIPPRWN